MHSISALVALGILTPVPQVEEPITQGKLTVYVVRASQTDPRSYITLDEGLKSGDVEVRERGSGDVNSLEVENGSDKYLFLHVGDIIRGGKQDRTIATDVLIPPRSAPIAVDAFCVEHGRWAADARTGYAFAANDALASGPALKRGIQRAQSQQEVWDAVSVAETAVAVYAASPANHLSLSGTYSAIVENEPLRAEREEYVEAVLPRVLAHEDAVGVVVAINGEIVGADIYRSHELFGKVARKLLDAYAQEAILSGHAPDAAPPTMGAVSRFLDDGANVTTESLSTTMERRSSDNADADIFEYRFREDAKPLHSSYVKKR
jgi:hypothetical protein